MDATVRSPQAVCTYLPTRWIIFARSSRWLLTRRTPDGGCLRPSSVSTTAGEASTPSSRAAAQEMKRG
jgi:hypothetical protein